MTRLLRSHRAVAMILVFTVSLALFVGLKSTRVSAKQNAAVSQASDDSALLESFRHVEVASVSDAMEQILGKKISE